MSANKQETIRTPLGHARGLGSSKQGTHHWWMQRVTGIALVPLSLYWLACLPGLTADTYGDFISWMQSPTIAIPAILFVIASFYHGALGIQVIIEDYVQSEGWKLSLLMLNNFFFFALGVVSIFAIAYINFGHSPS